ncbi:hypothetical protein [Acetobacterium carbinolicum]
MRKIDPQFALVFEGEIKKQIPVKTIQEDGLGSNTDTCSTL